MNPPTGATINTATGAFSWKPAVTGTYTFKVRVTDNGAPVLYDEEQITVLVSAGKILRKQNILPQLAYLANARLFPNPVITAIELTWEDFGSHVVVIITDDKGAVTYRNTWQGSGLKKLAILQIN